MCAAAVAAMVGLMRPGPAAAFWINGGAREISGNQNYNGLNAYGQVGLDSFSIKPVFQSFHTGVVNTLVPTGSPNTLVPSHALNTYSLRLGYDTKLIGLGVTGGATPSVDGYSNKFGGADLVLSLTPTGGGARERINGREQASGPAQGAGLARVDLGVSAMYTSHGDHVGAAGQTLGSVARLGQTDVTGSVGVAVLGSLLSVDVTKSAYDKKPGNLTMRAPRVEDILGLSQVLQGVFPNSSTNVKFLFGGTPVIKPYVSYTRTTFMAGVPQSHGYSAGLSAELQMLEVSANWERYAQTGQVDRNYFGLGASLRF